MIYDGMCCYNRWYKKGCVVIIYDMKMDVL